MKIILNCLFMFFPFVYSCKIDGHVICILQTIQAWLRWHITQPIKKSLCKIWMGNYLPYWPASGASLTDIIQRFSSTVDCGVPPNRMFKPRMQLILYSMEIKVDYINNTHKCFSSIIYKSSYPWSI